jgi:hypothetical protein
MCLTRARFGIDGRVYLAFRSAENKVRDFYVLRVNPLSNDFTAYRVNNDNWILDFCPMVGPELAISNNGNIYCAFMSSNHVYWSVSAPGETAFAKHISTPLNEQNEIYPTALENNSGKVLFLWQVGPMSVSDSATVKWALYEKDGEYTGLHGTTGRTFSGTKATAFVGTDDSFYIIICTENISSAAESNQQINIKLIPGPVIDFIDISKFDFSGNIEIFNISGIKIIDINASDKIDVSILIPGVYFLKADNQFYKFVKI